jgi:hypothetical protein
MASKFGGIAVETTRSKFGGSPVGQEQPAKQSDFDRMKKLQFGRGEERALDLSGTAADAVIDPLLTVGSAAIAEPLAGLGGLAKSITSGPEAGAETTEAIREGLTIQPTTGVGKAALGSVAETLAPVGEAISAVEKGLGDFAFELTGSPALAATAASVPTAVMELVGLKGLKSARPGTILKNAAGRPTKTLRKLLDKSGLDFDSLAPELKASIPDKIEPGILVGGGKKKLASEAEKIVAEQINTGARHDALAGLKTEGGKIVPDTSSVDAVKQGKTRRVGGNVVVDKNGSEAIKQGFSPGFIQAVKTSSPATKSEMARMSRIMRQIKKNERLGLDMRPSDVAGDSITGRIKFIRDEADVARKELNSIADKKLRGKEIDSQPVLDSFQEALSELDVELVQELGGVPKPNFKGSLISQDRSSQRVVKQLMSLMAEGGAPDALRFHKMKKQLDIMIDFNKKSASGLTDAGKKVLKKVRSSLNDSIREVDTDYARVNDVLSESLGTLDGLDDAVGSIDIFGTGANKALGTRMRALLSNQQGRVKIENAIDKINETTKNLGGKFDDDIKDLIMFSDGLEAKFGTTAKTSLAGDIGKVAEKTIGGARAAATEVVGKTVGKGMEKLRGVNDFNSFEALDALLK